MRKLLISVFAATVAVLSGFGLSAYAAMVGQNEKAAPAKWEMVDVEEEIFTFKSPAKHERRVHASSVVDKNSEDNFLQFYSDFKNELNNKLGFQFGLDISYLGQRVSPSGKQTAIQGMYYPYVTWDLFKDKALGSGKINFNYNLVRYWGTEAQNIQKRVNVENSINDYTTRSDLFSQFSYTHTLPGHLDWLSATIGQFPMYNFDGTTYDANQQTGLINYALSQNATATYPLASLGAYIQAAPGDWVFTVGYQDATNVSGSRVNFKTAFDGDYTKFASVAFNPTIKGLGAAQYSVMVYWQPSVPQQERASKGWTVNAEQNFGTKWSIFARANSSNNGILPIKQSYVLGASYLNPLNRNPLDVITVGVAYNRLSDEGLGYPDYYRTGETVIEAQWVWGFTKWLTITPDIQLYPKAGLSSDQGLTTVASLRTTLMF